jgi:hypothetical protein
MFFFSSQCILPPVTQGAKTKTILQRGKINYGKMKNSAGGNLKKNIIGVSQNSPTLQGVNAY